MRYPGMSGVFVLLLIVASVGAGECGGATIISRPIIGHWAFEEGGGSIAGDSSPNHLDGQIVNATYVDVKDATCPALGDYALAFNGSNTYVEVGNDSLLTPATIGISLWFKSNATSVLVDLLDKGHGSGSFPYYGGYVFQGLNSEIGAMYGNGSGFPGLGTGSGVCDGTWHHLVANLGQDAIELYVDTVPVPGGGLGAGSIVENDSPLFFGRHRTLGRYYDGLIGDIQLYDGALSQQDVIALYNAPEPATLSLLALGGLALIRRRRA
jgi:hypothetical protein